MSGNVGESLNQVPKEILKNFEHIQTYLVLQHHHQRGQVRHHGPGPGGQEEVNSFISFKKSTPKTLYSMAKENHAKKSILDKIWIKILFLFPITCSVGPEAVLGELE